MSSKYIMTALGNHPSLFMDESWNYSPTTVTNGLKNIHSHIPDVKGFLIADTNATHTKGCPALHDNFTPDSNGYSEHLHMGTTRIWKKDGTIDEERWKRFVDHVATIEHGVPGKVVRASKLAEYIKKCYDEDAQEFDTGRHSSLNSPDFLQAFMGKAAWNEVYDRLAQGWLPLRDKPNKNEAYISLELMRKFFENSTNAFQLAIDKKLPVPPPKTSKWRPHVFKLVLSKQVSDIEMAQSKFGQSSKTAVMINKR